MKITKYEHAFLVLEQNGQQLAVDPGFYSETLPQFHNLVAVTLSHVHDDHSYLPHVEKLVDQFPNLRIFGPLEVKEKLSSISVETCFHGDSHQVGEFTIEFSGDLHQEIHRSIPLVQNLAVLVNRKLFYPGDSYTTSEHPYQVLACPSSAPWLRISDVMDYLELQRPARCFPTHNALLSDHGHALQNGRIQSIVEKHGGLFDYLEVGSSIEI